MKNNIYEFYLENVKGYPQGHKVPLIDFKVIDLSPKIQEAIKSKYSEVYISSKCIKHIDESRPRLSEFIFKNITILLDTVEIYKNYKIKSKNDYWFYKKIERGYLVLIGISSKNKRNEITTIMSYNKKTLKKLEPFKVPVLNKYQNGTTTLENKSPFRPSGSDSSESMLP